MGFFKRLKSAFNNEDDGFGLLFQSGRNKISEDSWAKADFLGAYKTSVYVNKAIEKRATKVGEIQFNLTKGDKDVDPKQDKFGILNLLSKPNKLQTGRQFFALWQKYKDIYGEVYVLMIKDTQFLGRKGVSELHHLNPRYCEPKFNAMGELERVEYRRQNGEATTYQSDEIIYDLNPDPDNPLRGISLLKAGAKAISVSNQLDNYQATILRNGGKIDGVFNFKATGNLSKVQRDELKKDYKEMYSESTKSGTPLFLGGDADYKRMGSSPEELSYIESKKMTLNDICILTEVPKMLLASAEDIQYNNADTSLRIFLREVIKPLDQQITDVLNEKRELVPEEYELELIDPTPDDIEMKTKVIDNGFGKYMTINECRDVMDLEPVEEGGDDVLIPFSLSPLSSEPEPVAPVEPVKPDNEPVPSPSPDEENEPEEPKKSLKKGREVVKGPACRMDGETKKECVSRKIGEIMSEDPNISQEQAIAIAESVCSVSCSTNSSKSKKKSINHPLKSYDFRREYHKQFIKKANVYERKFKIKLNSYLKGQKERMLENIEQGRINSFKKKGLIDEIFNLKLEVEIGVKEIIPLLKEIARRSGEDAMKLVGSGGFKMNSHIESFLDLKANVFMKQINETTFTKLKSQFADSFANNEDRGELIKRVKETYGDISKGRANVIARTETHGITQEGTIEGYKQAEMPIKIWVAVIDDKTRESHYNIDGEEVPLDYPFSNGIMYPGDPNGDASEIVNCRCSI